MLKPARRLAAVVLFWFLAISGGAQLVRDWRAVRTTHFELISRYDAARTGELIQVLEWARNVFATRLGAQFRGERSTLVLIPDSHFDYEQISPSKWSDGYFLPAPWRDIIVMRQLLNARQGLLHEYSHLVLHQEAGRYPAWFDEGTAEYYATLREVKDGVEAGASDPGRVASLRKGPWLPISYLLSVGATASLDSQAAIYAFYAQSWLFVHMLHLSPAYREHFADFRLLLRDGTSTEQALRQIYSKSLVQFDDDARDWFRKGRLPTELLPPAPSAPANVEAKVIGEVEVEVARLTVAAAGPGKATAGADFLRLTRLAGGKCDLEAPLGDLAFAAGLYQQASAHYRAAIECGGNTAGLAQGLEAVMSLRGHVPRKEAEAVVSLTNTGHSHFMLGTALFFEEDYDGAIREFGQAKGIPQYDEFRLTRLTALSLAHLGRFPEAQEAARRLASMAAGVDQKQAAQLTLEDVQRGQDRAQNPPEPMHRIILRGLTRVDGQLIQVDCLGERARLWVRSGKETLKLLIADPGDVVTGEGEGVRLEFACGPQGRAVTVGYKEQKDAATDTIGRVQYMEMRSP